MNYVRNHQKAKDPWCDICKRFIAKKDECEHIDHEGHKHPGYNMDMKEFEGLK